MTLVLSQEGLPQRDEGVERERKAAERAERLRELAQEQAWSEAGRGEEPMAEAAEESAEAAEGAEVEEETEERKGKGPMVEIEVADASGEVIRTFERPATLGVNRLAWDLERDAFDRPRSGEEPPFWQRGGLEVPAGTYTVTVRHGGEEASGEVRVLPDPRTDVSTADRQAKYEAILEAGALRERLTASIERIRETRKDLEWIRAKAKEARGDDEGGDEEAEADAEGGAAAANGEADPLSRLLEAAGELGKRLDELEAALREPDDVKGITADTDAWSDVSYALGNLGSSWDAPTPAQLRYLEIARRATDEATAAVDVFYAEELAPFKAKVDEAALGLLAAPVPE